jgi:hypothetical protein
MPQPPIYRKRRITAKPNKNELKASRHEAEQRSRDSADTLRSRYPQVRSLSVQFRMESPSGAVLEESNRALGLDEAILLDVPCQGGCSGGVFKLTDAIVTALNAGQDSREGMGLCQASSYRDPTLPCGVKFLYKLTAQL